MSQVEFTRKIYSIEGDIEAVSKSGLFINKLTT